MMKIICRTLIVTVAVCAVFIGIVLGMMQVGMVEAPTMCDPACGASYQQHLRELAEEKAGIQR